MCSTHVSKFMVWLWELNFYGVLYRRTMEPWLLGRSKETSFVPPTHYWLTIFSSAKTLSSLDKKKSKQRNFLFHRAHHRLIVARLREEARFHTWTGQRRRTRSARARTKHIPAGISSQLMHRAVVKLRNLQQCGQSQVKNTKHAEIQRQSTDARLR